LAVALAAAVAAIGTIVFSAANYQGLWNLGWMIFAPAAVGLAAGRRMSAAVPFALLLGGVGLLSFMITMVTVYGGGY